MATAAAASVLAAAGCGPVDAQGAGSAVPEGPSPATSSTSPATSASTPEPQDSPSSGGSGVPPCYNAPSNIAEELDAALQDVGYAGTDLQPKSDLIYRFVQKSPQGSGFLIMVAWDGIDDHKKKGISTFFTKQREDERKSLVMYLSNDYHDRKFVYVGGPSDDAFHQAKKRGSSDAIRLPGNTGFLQGEPWDVANEMQDCINGDAAIENQTYDR